MTENVQQPFRYMGRELDAITGLYYVRNRWYDPISARFVSEDPIGLEGGINLYAYAANSPTNARDPSGLSPECPDGYVLTYFRNGAACVNSETGAILLPAAGGVTNGTSRSPYSGPYAYTPGARGGAWSGTGNFQWNSHGPFCEGGFSTYQCEGVQDAIVFLRTHPRSFCRAMGFKAQVRLYSGRMIYNPVGPPNVRAAAYISPGSPLFGSVTIYSTGFLAGGSVRYPWYAGELPRTLSHEEAHFMAGPTHTYDQGGFTGTPTPLGAPDEVGNRCGQLPPSS